MEDNKKSFIEKISIWITITAGIFTIAGFSLYSLFKNSDSIIAFITKNHLMVLLIINIIVLLFYVGAISCCKLKKQDNPPTLSIFIIVFLLLNIICLASLTFNNKTVSANNENNTEEEIEKTEEMELELNDNFSNYLTPEQEKVNYYVPKCKQEIFNTDFWSNFTDGELEHILNGIYVYEGMHFLGDYFNVFSWYNGYIESEDFTEDMLCYNQHKNIANIIVVLEQRGLR